MPKETLKKKIISRITAGLNFAAVIGGSYGLTHKDILFYLAQSPPGEVQIDEKYIHRPFEVGFAVRALEMSDLTWEQWPNPYGIHDEVQHSPESVWEGVDLIPVGDLDLADYDLHEHFEREDLDTTVLAPFPGIATVKVDNSLGYSVRSIMIEGSGSWAGWKAHYLHFSPEGIFPGGPVEAGTPLGKLDPSQDTHLHAGAAYCGSPGGCRTVPILAILAPEDQPAGYLTKLEMQLGYLAYFRLNNVGPEPEGYVPPTSSFYIPQGSSPPPDWSRKVWRDNFTLGQIDEGSIEAILIIGGIVFLLSGVRRR